MLFCEHTSTIVPCPSLLPQWYSLRGITIDVRGSYMETPYQFTTAVHTLPDFEKRSGLLFGQLLFVEI